MSGIGIEQITCVLEFYFLIALYKYQGQTRNTRILDFKHLINIYYSIEQISKSKISLHTFLA